jgi:signal transduction histidine kinase
MKPTEDLVSPPIPENEQQRLQNLESYDILERELEEEYDDIAQLAAEMCDAQIALVNFIDESKQWSKASFGMERGELERCNTVCQYTITTEKEFVVEDLAADDRFKDFWYVKDKPRLRFYAGVPLISSEGYNLGALCVLDTKPRKITEKQINHLKTLSDNIIDRIELRKKNRSLQNLTNDYRELIKLVSHDIRSPLHGIIGLSNLIVDDKHLPEAQRTKMLKAIEQSAQQLLLYTNEILEASLDSPDLFDLQLQEIEVADLTSQIIDTYEPYAQIKNISLDNKNHLGIKKYPLDEDKFRQILGNLISNAVKFTKPNGHIEVSTLPAQEHHYFDKDKGFVLMVKDNGIGIPETQKKELFNSNRSHRRKGTAGEKSTGVGLPLIKRFVEAHNGDINVESTEGEGTRISVFFPTNPTSK